jgi:hypothetical protein
MSALLSRLARNLVPRPWPDWLPGSLALVVLALLVLLLIQREVTRGLLSGEREARARATAVVVVPLMLCAALALGTRFLELVT